eukprot:1921418-Rhodomonas_salina.1
MHGDPLVLAWHTAYGARTRTRCAVRSGADAAHVCGDSSTARAGGHPRVSCASTLVCPLFLSVRTAAVYGGTAAVCGGNDAVYGGK